MIGSAITRVSRHHEVVPANRADADLLDYSQVVRLIESSEPDAIIHAAALVGGIGGNMMKSGEYFRNNILINTNVLEAARSAGVKNLLTFMSTCIFPEDSKYPLTVDQLHNGSPHPSNYAYAHAKRMLDIQVKAYNTQWNTEFKIVIPTNVYGIRDNFSLTEGHAVAALIHRIFLSKANGSPFTVWGSGKPLREFVYADDIARLSLLALENKGIREPVILTNGIETSISELVKMLVDLIGFENEVQFDLSKPDGQFRKPSSPAVMRALWPDFSFTGLRQGLEQTVDWFLREYPNVRK
jgi:GDP-L-fucose synthase